MSLLERGLLTGDFIGETAVGSGSDISVIVAAISQSLSVAIWFSSKKNFFYRAGLCKTGFGKL